MRTAGVTGRRPPCCPFAARDPNIEQLRNLAKTLQRLVRVGEPGAIDPVNRLTRNPHLQPVDNPISNEAELIDEFLRLA